MLPDMVVNLGLCLYEKQKRASRREGPWETLQETDPAIAQWTTILTTGPDLQMCVAWIPAPCPKTLFGYAFVLLKIEFDCLENRKLEGDKSAAILEYQ